MIWPSIDQELAKPREQGLLKGLVLNAGAGWRDISHLIEGELVNQDITYEGDTRTNLHIVSPLESIPRPDNTFDTIICHAVLEHVEDPFVIVKEFFRVVKPGGHVVASVPFLQPEHKVPTDFQRFTKDGLIRLFEQKGFVVEDLWSTFNVYITMHWIFSDFCSLQKPLLAKVLRRTILPILAIGCRRSKLHSDKLASAFQIVVRKPLNTPSISA